jgi:hypothetical protein
MAARGGATLEQIMATIDLTKYSRMDRLRLAQFCEAAGLAVSDPERVARESNRT